MEKVKSVSFDHTFKIRSQNKITLKYYKLDPSKVKTIKDVVLILGALNIQISVPDNISESQYAAIEKFLVEA
jgi:hypothetical protein